MAMSNEELLADINEANIPTDNTAENTIGDQPITADDTTDLQATTNDGEPKGDQTNDGEPKEGEPKEGEPKGDEPNDDEPTFEITVNGEQREVTLEELQRGYNTQQAANEKFQAAAEQRKQSEHLINLLKTDPMAVLADPAIGLDPQQVAQDYLHNQTLMAEMSDTERELALAKNQLAEYQQAQTEMTEQAQQAQFDQATADYTAEYNSRIEKALTDTGLPITQNTVQHMSNYMLQILESDDPTLQNIPDSELASLVREDYVADFQKMFGQSDAKSLASILGSDTLDKIRIQGIEDASVTQSQSQAPSLSSSPASNKKMTQDEWNTYLDGIK